MRYLCTLFEHYIICENVKVPGDWKKVMISQEAEQLRLRLLKGRAESSHLKPLMFLIAQK